MKHVLSLAEPSGIQQQDPVSKLSKSKRKLLL
jgi:hypothetical protein